MILVAMPALMSTVNYSNVDEHIILLSFDESR